MVTRRQYTKEYKLDAIKSGIGSGAYDDRSISESGNQCQYTEEVDQGVLGG